MNGFANAKKSAMPTPIIATASSNADDEEHLRAQHRRELRLSRGAFEEAPAERAHADGDAERAEADQNRDGDRRQANYSFHSMSPVENGSKRNPCCAI